MCEEGLLEKVSYGFYRAMKHTARADQSLPSAMTRESVSATFCILHLRMCREELGDLLAALALSHKRNDLFGAGYKQGQIIGKCVQHAGDISSLKC